MMRSAEASGLGSYDKVLEVTSTRPKPVLQPKSSQLLVKVAACSLSPGDWRTLSGETKSVRQPKNGFPYVPCADICGTVEAVGELAADKFSVGDQIVGTWAMMAEGGLAEYTLVDKSLAAKVPGSIDPLEGAALANSAAHAMQVVQAAKVKPGDRVLVLGGSGGVGTIAIQLVKNAGAAFIATTSTQISLTTSLGADECVDYTKEEWSTKYKEPFDVIIDCAEGIRAWRKAKEHKLLKKGVNRTRFVATVIKEWELNITGMVSVMVWLASPLFRQMRTSISMGLTPQYTVHLGESNGEMIAEVLRLVNEGKLRAVVDTPHPFTTEGVRDAFRQLEKRKGHGKIVVKIE